MHALSQRADASAGWQLLRGHVDRQSPLLSAPQPAGAIPLGLPCGGGSGSGAASGAAAGIPSGAAAGIPSGVAAGVASGIPGGVSECALCRGPARRGSPFCFRCGWHREYLPGLMPDAVVPVAYAAKGGQHAANLWLYKSGRPGAAGARAALTALLLVFLRDHGGCVWRRAGMARPSHVAVVPSRRGRPGTHPLQQLAAPYLALPWVRLRLAGHDSPDARHPDPWRFESERIAGASVVLLDDTWTSGASAASAAAALRLAGARRVAVVVLGRHLDAAAAGGGRFSPAAMPFRPWLCAVHQQAPAA